MKLFSLGTLLLLITFGFGQSRPIEFSDLFGMGRVKDPQISPSGQYTVYTITWYNINENNNNSDIYLITTDGKDYRQLTSSPKINFSLKSALLESFQSPSYLFPK